MLLVSRVTLWRELYYFPAQPEVHPLGSGSGVNSTPMNVAFHWNGFSCAAPGAKLNTFELFNTATFLRGFPSPVTKVLSHWQVLSFIDCTTPLPQIPACAEAQFAPLALPAQP